MRRSLAMVCATGVLLLGEGCHNPLAPEVFAKAPAVDPSRVRVVIPEVYELSNVIIALTGFGQSNPFAVNRQGEYYQRVTSAFFTFRNHSSMSSLQLGSDDPARRYYEFRDNSAAYVFEDGEIRRNPLVNPPRSPNLFRERRDAAQSFADATRFREFFAANGAFYANQIVQYRGMADIDGMADWLEREFPGTSYRHYTVVLSPLVYAMHSAYFPSNDEAFFFVSGPDVTTGAGTSEGVKRATVQRILFTEIDHAFVNPTSDRHSAAINLAFANRATWTTDTSSFYNSPVAVFNEYMTWAAFLLFARDRLGPADFASVNADTIQLMQGRRFPRFGEFAAELLRLYQNRQAGTTVADLYPQIIAWASTQ